jgi:hypothetical protein
VESLGFEFQYGQKMFSTPKNIQTGSGAHPASYLMGAGVLPGDERLRRDVDHPPPSGAEVNDGGGGTTFILPVHMYLGGE